MSLEETMTGLMNAARSSVGIDRKLTLSSATKELEDFTKMPNQLLAFPEIIFGNFKSKSEGNSQIIEFDSDGFFELLPSNVQYLNVKKGDKVRQSFLLETANDIPNFTISFYAYETGHQIRTASINRVGKNLYKVSADYTCIADVQIRLLDFYVTSLPAGHYIFKLSQPFAGFISQIGG